MRVKILSDFDGVWTDQALEAENVKLFLVAEAARMAQVSADRAAEDFARFERIVKATPARYGWAPDGRITAYVDEDPFCEANSIGQYLTESVDDGAAATYARAVLASGFATLSAFADHCFFAATNSFRAQHPPALVPGAKALFEALRSAGADVVVVSNSTTDKIATWFREIGVDAGERPDNALRVRGSAGKYVIGPTDAAIELEGRRIYVDRPKYRRILEEERPDLVIGDVFSLDLALPSVMRRDEHPGAPSELVLRVHPHTPRWVLDTRANGAIDALVHSVGELVPSVERFARARR